MIIFQKVLFQNNVLKNPCATWDTGFLCCHCSGIAKSFRRPGNRPGVKVGE